MITFNKNWYHDGIEDGEDLWRLDPEANIQIQVFVDIVGDGLSHGDKFRLFIEHDVREKTKTDPSKRVKYSAKEFPITPTEAHALLLMDETAAVQWLRNRINEVIAMPDGKHMLKE